MSALQTTATIYSHGGFRDRVTGLLLYQKFKSFRGDPGSLSAMGQMTMNTLLGPMLQQCMVVFAGDEGVTGAYEAAAAQWEIDHPGETPDTSTFIDDGRLMAAINPQLDQLSNLVGR